MSLQRRSALLLLLVVPVTLLALFLTSLAKQASFFSMQEYLRPPMWTESMPPPLHAALLGVAYAIRYALFALGGVAACGLLLLVVRRGAAGLFRAGWWLAAAVLASMPLYLILATAGYVSVRQALPERFGETVAVYLLSVSVPGSLLVVAWMTWRGVPDPAVTPS